MSWNGSVESAQAESGHEAVGHPVHLCIGIGLPLSASMLYNFQKIEVVPKASVR